jgi:hypothetical protein
VDADKELADLARACSRYVGWRWKIRWVKGTKGEITSLDSLDNKVLILAGVRLVPYEILCHTQ